MARRLAVHHRASVGTVHGDAGNSRQSGRALHTGSLAWQATRKRILIRDCYTCQICERYGNHVDHKDGDDSNQADDNLWTLCRFCHSAKTKAEQGLPNLLPRMYRPPVIPVTLVAGPPGSGKTTYARQQAALHDATDGGSALVLDVDDIKSELSGQPVHESPDDVFAMAIWERNRRLIELSRPGPFSECWFVAMAPKLHQRRHWRHQLNARSIVLEVSASECLRRIARDPSRRGRPMAYWTRLVERWWSDYIRDAEGSGERVVNA